MAEPWSCGLDCRSDFLYCEDLLRVSFSGLWLQIIGGGLQTFSQTPISFDKTIQFFVGSEILLFTCSAEEWAEWATMGAEGGRNGYADTGNLGLQRQVVPGFPYPRGGNSRLES